MTPNKVLKKYLDRLGLSFDHHQLGCAITDSAKHILEYGPACGGRQILLEGNRDAAASFLAAMILVHQGKGDMEIDEEE